MAVVSPPFISYVIVPEPERVSGTLLVISQCGIVFGAQTGGLFSVLC